MVLTDLRRCPQGRVGASPDPLDKSDLQGRGALLLSECLHQDGPAQLLPREGRIGENTSSCHLYLPQLRICAAQKAVSDMAGVTNLFKARVALTLDSSPKEWSVGLPLS